MKHSEKNRFTLLSSTGEMHAQHLGCHVVHPSVLGFWSSRLG